MNAELFEDEALCNISPLPKHLFDVGGVPKPENNQITLPLFWTISLQICRGLLCFIPFHPLAVVWWMHTGYGMLAMLMPCVQNLTVVFCVVEYIVQYCRLGLHNLWKIYRHCNIHIAANCLNCYRLYSMYQLFTLCVTVYLAHQMELYSPRWPPPIEKLVSDVSNWWMNVQSKKSTRWLKESKKENIFRAIKMFFVQVIKKWHSHANELIHQQ